MLTVGDVSLYDYPDQFNNGYLTGAQPLWSDGDDATSATGFATLEPTFAVATIMYAHLSGSGSLGSELPVTVRATWGIANTGFLATTAFVTLYDTEPIAPTDSLASEFIEGSGLGLVEDLPITFSTASMSGSHTWPEVQAALELGNLWISVQPAFPDAYHFNNGLTVYELTAGNPARIVPARRLFPRTDDLGIGVGRIYPPPNTQQAGRRFGSAAPL